MSMIVREEFRPILDAMKNSMCARYEFMEEYLTAGLYPKRHCEHERCDGILDVLEQFVMHDWQIRYFWEP